MKNPGVLARVIRKQSVKRGIGVAHILEQEARDGIAAGDAQQPRVQPREVEGARVVAVAGVVLAEPPVLHAEFERMRAAYPTEQVVDDVGWPESRASSVASVAVVIIETHSGLVVGASHSRNAGNLVLQFIAEIHLITSQVEISKVEIVQQCRREGVIPVQAGDVAVVRVTEVRRINHARQFCLVERMGAAIMIIPGEMILIANVFIDAKIPPVGDCESDRRHGEWNFIVMQDARTIRGRNEFQPRIRQ